MEHYVTLFDSLFLPQGLALHASLQRHGGCHTLWVLCIDDTAFQTLSQMALPNMRLLAIEDVLTDALRQVMPSRSRAEWCWTLTPFTPAFVFNADSTAQRVTYVDADLWLSRNPKPVFDEFEATGKAVLITEHAFAPEYDQSHNTGRFCVQFMTFVRDRGETVRTWWADRCIEWCYARFEDGKFGDQKYLDDWPQRFAEHTHVLQNRALLQAPWNATRFAPSDCVAYHFHGLRTMRHGRLLLTIGYKLPRATLTQVYEPYRGDLSRAHSQLTACGFSPRPQVEDTRLGLLWQHFRSRGIAWLHRAISPLFMQL